MKIRQLIIIQIVLLGLQTIIYFGCEIFQKNPHDVEFPIDKKIPAIPLFTLIYILWFPLIFIFPIHLYQYSVDLYKFYLVAWILDVIISIFIYMIYPTTFKRPDNLDEIKYGWMLKLTYKGSFKGLNCMPSMHCSISTLVLIFAFLCSQMPIIFRIIYSVVSIGIIFSTLFTKQHVIIDVITGIILAFICYGCGYFIVQFI